MTEGLFAFRRVRKSFCVSQKREETAQPLLPVLSQESLNFIEVELAFGHQNLQVTGLGKQWRTSFANLVSKTRKAFSFEGVSWKIQNEELFILCAQMVKISRKVKPFIKILSARLKSWPWTNLKKSAGLALEQRSFSASLRSFLSPFFPPPPLLHSFEGRYRLFCSFSSYVLKMYSFTFVWFPVWSCGRRFIFPTLKNKPWILNHHPG